MRGPRGDRGARGTCSTLGSMGGSQEIFNKLYCQTCKERGHGSLLFCPKFPKFIPRENDVKSVPREVCKLCLDSTAYQGHCNHKALKDCDKSRCNTTNMHFLLCNQCAKHMIAQDWMKVNFDFKLRKKNLNSLWQGIGDNTAVVNSIQIMPNLAPVD